ncbi:unnamed protein product [Rotaria sordida]|uniref:Actin interacting protein 3 C-terminal domain-containing protein n=1 Tax=Rotaria sordida TaxID=392033 RepID=A0A813XHU7_9BILA|nr:unnamed protein product [Rotaria sordida]
MGLSDSKIQRYLQTSYILTDSSTNTISRKNKSNDIDHYQSTKSCQNMKSIISPKTITADFSDIERNNIYAETPPKMKSTTTLKNDTNHYIPIRQQRRPPIPVRTDSMRSIGSTTISSFSSQSTTPSNSFRHDSTTIMSRSADATTSSCELITPIKNDMNHLKSKSTCDIETSILNNHNKCLNMITNGNFVPLQAVKEDECLEIDDKNNNNKNNNEKYSQNDNRQQRIVSDILKKKNPTSMMSRNNALHQRSSSTDPTDDELPIGYINGFNRNNRVRSSLPFIVKPAVNKSKSNSLGLCFLICGNETKKVLLPAYISCLDTLKALFVRAFPQYLTMKQMDSDCIRIYIRESDKDIFYQLEDMSDVKDRSILKIVQLNNNNNNNKPHVSFKEPEIYELSGPIIKNEMNCQRLNRFGLTSSTNGSIENKSNDTSSYSLNDLRHGSISVGHTQPATILKGILSSPRSTPTTPRNDEEAARTKMVSMEKQLESLTALVKELTNPIKSKTVLDYYNKSLHQQLHELKIKTHTLRNDLFSIRRMQQSLHENFKNELEQANKKIQEQFIRLNQNEIIRQIKNEFDLYVNNRTKIDQDLEDLELTVEEFQNDVKFKQCYAKINDVESFALVLSTISRSLVDLKTTFPVLREKLSSCNQPLIIKFLHEEPECLDYTIKKCKRLTTMLYQLKQLACNQQNKSLRKFSLNINEKLVDRKRLLEEIQSITLNSEGRIKAIEKAEKIRERRLHYENQLENLKQIKPNSDQVNGYFDNRSLTNSLSTRTSICSTDSNNYLSPSSSYVLRQALINSSIINDSKTHLQSSIKPTSKVTFSQQLITNDKTSLINKKPKPNPPPRIQSTPSSSIISSASSSSSTSSSSTNGNSRFCGIIPLLSVDRRLNGRCYSFSSSSTDTDSIVSNSHKSTKLINTKSHQTTLMRASVTDLYIHDSSNKDYNRVLEKQPRKSIGLAKFDVQDRLQQHPLVGTLSIPDPVRFSQLKKQSPDSSNEQPRSPLNQTLIQSFQPRNLTPVTDNQIQQEQYQPEKQLIIRKPSYYFQLNFPMYNEPINNDAIVIARSVINFNNQRQFNNNQLSSFQPNGTIIEHNGKQYLTDLRERIEQRCVEIFDENTGRIRLFEVTDYIPTRIIQTISSIPQSQLQRRTPLNGLPPRFPLNQSSRRLPISSDPKAAVTSSNLADIKDLNNRETLAREFDLYQSGARLPINNDNASPQISSKRQATNHRSRDLSSPHPVHSQSNASNSLPSTSKNVPDKNLSKPYHSQVPSIRLHSPTASNNSTHSSETKSTTSSDDSDSETTNQTSPSYNRTGGNNRNNIRNSRGTTSGYNSSTQFDPFAKRVNTRDHHYIKRSGVNNYSEPTINNRMLQKPAVYDYAPIPAAYKQSNRNQYIRRGQSDFYDG